MAPGDIRTASFDVSIDSDATVKEYSLDSEVLYRDVLDNQFTSHPSLQLGSVTARRKLSPTSSTHLQMPPVRSRDRSIHLKFFSIQSKILMGIISPVNPLRGFCQVCGCRGMA